MFGHHRRVRKREEKAMAADKSRMEQSNREFDQSENALRNEAHKLAQEKNTQHESDMAEGRKKADEFTNREFQGLSDKRRTALEERGKHRIQRQHEEYGRQLSGMQGRKGIRGGTAFAQQQSLADAATEAGREAQRDVDLLDQETAMKNKAAHFALEQWHGQQPGLNRQQAYEELQQREDRKRGRANEDQLRHMFMRLSR